MFINIAPTGFFPNEEPDWQQFTITPQDFHRHKKHNERLIIDSPAINAAFTDAYYVFKGKLQLYLPYDVRFGPVVMGMGSGDWMQLCRCLLTDAELKMLLLIRWPRMMKDTDFLQTFMRCYRNSEYRDKDGKLYPNLKLPHPYNDILYRDYAEPWKPIHIIDPAAV